jgi:hypothetical protein
MTEFFYEVHMTGACGVDTKFFRSFARAYAFCAEYNDECGNSYADNETAWNEVRNWGETDVGCYEIFRREFSD